MTPIARICELAPGISDPIIVSAVVPNVSCRHWANVVCSTEYSSHVETKKRSGRPTKISDENTAAVLNYVRQTKATRSANADQIAEESGSGLSKALVPSADEAAQRLESQRRPPSTLGNSPPCSTRLRPDQICVYAGAKDGNRSLAFVVEYKAPHKLTLARLGLGLRDMEISEVVDRYEVPRPEAK